MDNQENINRRGELVVGMRMHLFNEDPSFENAQGVFLACRKYQIDFPEPILEVLTKVFQEEYEKNLEKIQAQLERSWEKEANKHLILGHFLLEKNQNEAARSFLEASGKNNISDSEIRAIRTKAERFIREIYPDDKDISLSKLLARYRIDTTE